MSTQTNQDITADEAEQTPAELGTLADYSIDGVEYDTPNLFDESIEGRVHSSGASYTGEYFRESGNIRYMLDSGEDVAEKPETRMCIDVRDMNSAIHSIYILKESSDKDELLAAFRNLKNRMNLSLNSYGMRLLKK